MIYLCSDKDRVESVIDKGFGSACIRHTIELYLRSYGTDYDFAQFYIQECTECNIATALILRYNQTVYSVSDNRCDVCELSAFLGGFSDVTLISDITLTFDVKGEFGAVMSKIGVTQVVHNTAVIPCNEPKPVCNLVCENLSECKKTDFYLNTSHQMRHGLLSIYAYFKALRPVSVASVACVSDAYAVIPFVYTGEYFRGNGYSRIVLDSVCNDPCVTYQLLCEEHNIKFYEKCGFAQSSGWVKYCL